jgi:hypothetical protein
MHYNIINHQSQSDAMHILNLRNTLLCNLFSSLTLKYYKTEVSFYKTYYIQLLFEKILLQGIKS